MTSFVQSNHPTEHAGVARLERAVQFIRHTWRRSAHGSLALAAIVAAALVVANEVIETWTDGHLLAAWIVMWLIAFGAMAIFARPAKRVAAAAADTLARWRTEGAQAHQDQRLRELAQADARAMADISREMDARVNSAR